MLIIWKHNEKFYIMLTLCLYKHVCVCGHSVFLHTVCNCLRDENNPEGILLFILNSFFFIRSTKFNSKGFLWTLRRRVDETDFIFTFFIIFVLNYIHCLVAWENILSMLDGCLIVVLAFSLTHNALFVVTNFSHN